METEITAIDKKDSTLSIVLQKIRTIIIYIFRKNRIYRRNGKYQIRRFPMKKKYA